ncbi:MAG: Calx-beta domain-containing protein [Planctomycetota bacterium]
MSKKLLCLATVVLLLGLCNISFGVELLVDIGCSGGITQPGWLNEPGCRGFGPGSNACECRVESGATHELKWVHQTFIKQDGANPQPPNSDMVFTLSDLTPGAEYELVTYHDYWDAPTNVIDSITVTGATNVTKPSSIVQSQAFVPGEFTFTAGSGDVVVRYSCLSGGQPYFNGFELYGGGSTVQFQSDDSGELETVTSVDIPVTINGPNESETYEVDYAVIGGTAVGGGDDYTLASGTLTFLPGSAIEYITIDVNDDSEHEDDETVIIELSNPNGPGLVFGNVTVHTYTIIDPRPDVLFRRPSGSGMEDVSPAYAPVRLSRPTRNTVTVNYTVTGGTATGGGIDYTLSAGTVVFGPNETNGNIPITIISDANDAEGLETIIIELSSPTNSHLGSLTEYTHTIVSEPIDLYVDFALPYCTPDNNDIRPETAKPGWWHWASPRWYDMYSHDCVWEDGTGSKPTDSGIDDTGIHAAVTLIREGDMGLKVSGLVMPALNGGCPTDSPIYEPICNSWLQAIDWPTPDSAYGSIQLALHDLPAGAYMLYSYHNHFGCYRGTPVHCDCSCSPVPPMPVIKGMSVKDAYELPHTGGSFGKLFPGYDPDALPEGVISIQDACNIQPQQVTTDAELVPSMIKFATDGSPVLVLYQGGCCEPDPVRDDRDGGRGILNAFRLIALEDAGMACCPNPGNGDGNVPPDVTLTWQPGLYADSHDVYLDTDSDAIQDANTAVTLGVYRGRQDACEHDPAMILEFSQTYYWRVDEVNGPNIWPGSVWSFTVDNGKACCPSPTDGGSDIARDVILSWSPGIVAASHNIYFGTSFSTVNDATTSSSQYKGNQALGNETYDPCDRLQLGRTYYWRIDEVNPPYVTTKGDVWNFTAVECIAVDDMESYCAGAGCGNQIYDTWIDNLTNLTGSYIGLGVAPDPVHAGSNSMQFQYDNDFIWADHDYSETERAFADPCDWDGLGADLLTLYFYGDPGNDANSTEQMYLGLEDDTGPGSYVQVANPNMADVQVAEWHRWDIEFSDFSSGGVNLSAVKKIYIGFGDRDDPVAGGSGIVYFDDIQVCSQDSTCWQPSQCAGQPNGDATCDGSVNLGDLFALKAGFGKCAPWTAPECCADFTQDGCINLSDLFALKAGFGTSGYSPATGNQSCPLD